MNLEQYLTENPAATLADAQAYTETIDKKQVGSGQARGYFVSTGIWTKLKSIQADITHPLFALADAVIVTASDASSYFGLDTSTNEGKANIAGAQTLVDAGVMTSEERDGFLALATKTIQPFANITQLQYNQAKQIYTEKVVANYARGQDIKLTLIDALPENCAVTTWNHSAVFGYENLGKIAQLKTDVSVYRIKMDSVKVEDELVVRIPFANVNFSVEAI